MANNVPHEVMNGLSSLFIMNNYVLIETILLHYNASLLYKGISENKHQ